MYHNLNIPDDCHALWETCHSLVPKLLRNITIKSNDLILMPNKPIKPQSKSFYLIKSGTISETYKGKVVVNYEEGDMIGVDGLMLQDRKSVV